MAEKPTAETKIKVAEAFSEGWQHAFDKTFEPGGGEAVLAQVDQALSHLALEEVETKLGKRAVSEAAARYRLWWLGKRVDKALEEASRDVDIDLVCLAILELDPELEVDRPILVEPSPRGRKRAARSERAEGEIERVTATVLDETGNPTGEQAITNENFIQAFGRIQEVRERRGASRPDTPEVQVNITGEILSQIPEARDGRITLAGREIRESNLERAMSGQNWAQPFWQIELDQSQKEGNRERVVGNIPVIDEEGNILMIRVDGKAYERLNERFHSKGKKKGKEKRQSEEKWEKEEIKVRVLEREKLKKPPPPEDMMVKKSFVDELREVADERSREGRSFPLVFMAGKRITRLPRANREGRISFMGLLVEEEELARVFAGRSALSVFTMMYRNGGKVTQLNYCLPIMDAEGDVVIVRMSPKDFNRSKKRFT